MGKEPTVVVAASPEGFTSIPPGTGPASTTVLAEVTLHGSGQWLIQARAEFRWSDGTAGNTGDVQCNILAVPAAGLPEGSGAENIDGSGFLLSPDHDQEFVPYLGTVTVREPTHIRMVCTNFIIEVPGDPVLIRHARLVAMKVNHVDKASDGSRE